MSQVHPSEGFPMWVIGGAVTAITITTASTILFRRKRKQPSIKKISQN